MYYKSIDSLLQLTHYDFKNEEELQRILFSHPEIITNISELGIGSVEIAYKFREYPTSRGPVDVLYISSNADIILIETKLIRNPESIRTVIAQVIDYIKAISQNGLDNITSQKVRSYTDFVPNDRFWGLLSRNIQTGNINAVIIGDDIHPNLLGLVESIQSAAHLAFHINLIKVEAYELQDNLVINAFNVENTREVERSVIRISFGNNDIKPIIESETPSIDGQGSRPILSWDQYLSNVDSKYQSTVNEFRQEWLKNFGNRNSINMGTAGFSCGLLIGSKRQVITFVLNWYIDLITENSRDQKGFPDLIYEKYKTELKKTPEIFDGYLMSGKTHIPFNQVSIESLKNVFNATLLFARDLKNQYEEE